MRYLIGFVLFLLALGTLRTVGCGDDPCGGCDDADPCTEDRCEYDPEDPSWDFSLCQSEDPEDYRCHHYRRADGSPCGGDNVCVDGTCSENLCAGCEDDGNSCTIDCDYRTGACDYVPLPDGDSCKGEQSYGCNGEQNYGRCYGGVCIICEEFDCDDGDLCTTDQCDHSSGCVNYPVDCSDRNKCTVDACNPETGECSNTPDDGHVCFANRELGLSGEYLYGFCESDRCTGQPCDVTSEEVYPCPVEDDRICCPWESEYVPRGYCTTQSQCGNARCEEECPDTESNPQRSSHCRSYADGDCALVDYCHAECASYPTQCMYQDGVCPSP